MLCAAPTVLIGIAHGPEELRHEARRGVRVLTAGAPPAATTIERIEGELGWVITQAYRCEQLHSVVSLSFRFSCRSRQRALGIFDLVDETFINSAARFESAMQLPNYFPNDRFVSTSSTPPAPT